MKRSKLLHLVAAALTLAGCSDNGPIAPSSSPSAALLDGSVSVVQRVQPGQGGSATQVIGREGGTITVAGVSLAVPAGALNEAIALTVIVPPGRDVAAQMLPHGLTFKRPVSVTFSLRGTAAENATANDAYAGAYSAALPQNGKSLPLEVFTLSLGDRSLTLQTTHFSVYGIVCFMKGFILVGG